MAVNPRDEAVYDGKINEADLGNYPYGKAQNITTPGDGTGTPWDQIFINEIWGLMAAMLGRSGITPDGNPETAVASQYADAIEAMARRTAKARFASVQDLVTSTIFGQVVSLTAGQVVSTGHTDWRILAGTASRGMDIAGSLKAIPLNGVALRDCGAVGDYDTDDSAAITYWLNLIGSLRATGSPGIGVYRHTVSYDLPAEVVIKGVGSPKIAHFPQFGGDKDKLRPGFKHEISGSVFIFSGTATATYTTNRSDRYGSLTYVWRYPHFSGFECSDVAFMLDADVRDAAGNLTTAANDNSSDADAMFINNGTLASLKGVTIFGYPNDAAYVVHNQNGGNPDSDYNAVGDNCLFSGGVAIIGHDLAAGAASEGLTGNRFVDSGIYGGDHHTRADGDYTRPAIFIDGYMGDNDQSGIRGTSFTACNIRTYANDSIVTGYCNDIAFVNNVYEFPTLTGVTNADAQGGFVGHAGTRRFRAVCAASTDEARMFTYLTQITGPFQVIGAGAFDHAIFGRNGVFSRVGAINGKPFVQMGDDPGTQTNGWFIEWDTGPSGADTLDIRHDGTVVGAFGTGGGLRKGGLGAEKGNLTIASGGVTVGTFNNIGLNGQGGNADTLTTINGGKYDGEIITLRTNAQSAPITVVESGNIRLSQGEGSMTLDNGQDRLMLQYDGQNWVELSRSNNT